MKFIANLDTSVPVTRTIDQMRQLVEKFGAREFTSLYDDGMASGIRFRITDPHMAVSGDLTVFTVELRAPTDTIFKAIRGERDGTDAMREKARRVAWRQLHDIVRSSLIGVQSGLLTVGEAFLANLIVVTGDKERRFGEALAESRLLFGDARGRLLLGGGK